MNRCQVQILITQLATEIFIQNKHMADPSEILPYCGGGWWMGVRYKFSKLSSLLKWLYKAAVLLTFEKFCHGAAALDVWLRL